LRDFEAEPEAGRSLVPPAPDRGDSRAAVEGAVHLNDVVVLGVVGQIFAGRQALGVEHPGPILVGPAATADADRVPHAHSLRCAGFTEPTVSLLIGRASEGA